VGNVLKMVKRNQIRALLDLGWTYRAIEKATGVRRETVSRYDHRRDDSSKAAKVPTDEAAKPATCPPGMRSSAWNYDQQIREGLKKGLTAQRIYQDLKVDLAAEVSYDAIKRYVRKLKTAQPEVYARMHSPPGKEAQVDFGTGAPTKKEHNYRRPWLFKLVLSNSRHSYEEVVWHQDVETFIRCHERAFQALGGVPETIKLDNLKSGVLQAHLYEPELNPVYQQFAEHYGFIPLPCLPGKPEHKGKTEAGVKYTQNNALKGRRFDSLEEQNAFLKRWNKTWARTRIHGTTKQQVWHMFQQEKPFLKPLPPAEFEYFKISCRTVHADGHIEVRKAYYSIPYMYLGSRVTVHYNSKWVKVFVKQNGVLTQIAFHRVVPPGRFKTETHHLPEKKCFTTASYTKYLKEKCTHVGEGCERWANIALQEREQRAFRPIQGILSLTKKYGTAEVNEACKKAILLHSYRYHTVKLLCEDYTKADSPHLELIQDHELIRETREYQNYIDHLQ
jgi:transposase